MPEISLLAKKSVPGKIGGLVLDAVLHEGHGYSNTVTDNPIESGANVSDHIRREPPTITITGFITNTPLQVDTDVTEKTINEISDNQAKGLASLSSNRVQAAFVALMDVVGEDFPDQPSSSTYSVRSPRIIEVVTGLRVYSDMAITNLSIDRRPEDGESITFNATFKKIVKVRLSQVTIPNAKSVGAVGGSAGNAPRVSDQASSKKKKAEMSPAELKSVLIRSTEWLVPQLEALKGKLDTFFSAPSLLE